MLFSTSSSVVVRIVVLCITHVSVTHIYNPQQTRNTIVMLLRMKTNINDNKTLYQSAVQPQCPAYLLLATC